MVKVDPKPEVAENDEGAQPIGCWSATLGCIIPLAVTDDPLPDVDGNDPGTKPTGC